MQYVEYIQTDGYCWFDTGLYPSINTKIEVDIKTLDRSSLPSSQKNWGGIFGSQNVDDANSTFQIRNYDTNNKFSARVGNGEGVNNGPTYVLNTRYLLTLDRYYFSVDGTQYSTNTSSMDTCNYTMFISAINNSETGDNWSNHRAVPNTFYGIKVWENNVLVGDFKPAVDNNSNVGFYDEVTSTFKQNLGTGTPVAGPSLSSIAAEASKTSLAASGETINITVTCENAWTVTGNTFLTLSSTGDTGSTTITTTAPSYTGATARTDTLTFTDSVTGDEAEITIKQKKYTSGQPFYLGTNEVSEIYLGDVAITEAYLGDVQVFSSGPFVGLKVTPSGIEFNSAQLTSTIKVKSSESWSMTLPAWLSASQTTGSTGETTVTLTATAQSSATSGTIVVTSANYSASVTVIYNVVEFVNYVYQNSESYIQSSHLDTGIAHTASTMTVRLKYQARGGNSDRMVGYSAGDEGCSGDFADFRIFGWTGGQFDYGSSRWATGTINTSGQAYDITIGDRFAYNNIESRYLVNQSASGVVPSPNCHILVDLSYNKVNEVIIDDGNTVLFDGKAAKMGNDYGLYDTVGGTFITSTDFVIVGDCDAECQCLNNGGQWINNRCVYPPIHYKSMPLTIESIDTNDIKLLSYHMSNTYSGKYSINSGAPVSFTVTSGDALTITGLSAGDKVQFTVDTDQTIGIDTNSYRYFNSTGRFNVYGNAMSVIYANYTSANAYDRTIADLFDSSKVVDASNLWLGDENTSIISNCFRAMFYGCTGLTAAPALPFTTLAASCYQTMFRGCSSLTTAPELPATTLANSCYRQMFQQCTSLTTAPVLSAAVVPQEAYYQMFLLCSSLNYIKCLATSLGTSATFNWAGSVSATGTFVKNADKDDWSTGGSGIPSGWTVEDYIVPITNKTLTVTNIEESMTMGQARTCSITGVFDFTSDYDDIEMQAANTLTTESGYSGSYANNTITVTGPFDGSGYVVRCGGLAGGCDSIGNDISVTFTGDTATVQADFTPTTDPECECLQQGGTWDGSQCTYPEPEDPCIADPCMCDPNPDECYCIQQGGTWNGSECVFE